MIVTKGHLPWGVTTYAGKVLDPVSDQSLRAAKSAEDGDSGHFLASRMFT